MERKNHDYLASLVAQMTPADLLPGARELLEELRQAGLKAAVGSASKTPPK